MTIAFYIRFFALSCLFILLLASANTSHAETVTPPPHHIARLTVDPATGTLGLSDRISVMGGRKIVLNLGVLQISALKLDGAEQEIQNGIGYLTLPESRLYEISLEASGRIASKTAQEQSGQLPLFSEEAVYLPSWANWFPLSQNPQMTYDLTIETPAAYRGIAPGRLENEELGAERNTARFLSETTLEAPSVFIGPYEVAEHQAGKTRIRTYFPKQAAPLADDYLNASQHYIAHFSEKIGPYPFADFHIISSPLPVGMGFPNLTYVYQRILPMPFMKTRSLAHEVLHNWWGNGVQADARTGNWSEGLTTYMADHDLAAASNSQAGAEMRLGWLRDYAALPAERDMPVTHFTSKQHDASQVIGYGKVAFIFHMLKADIGAERFDEALRLFWQEYRFKVAGWRDIRAVFEKVTGSDLAWYFDQWTIRSGAPHLTLADAKLTGEGKARSLAITLEQSAPFYRLNVPVRIVTEAGTTNLTIPIDGDQKTETVQLNGKIVSLNIDPEHSLFRRLLPGEAPPILRDILLDKAAETILLGEDEEWRNAAGSLAAALFRTPSVPPLAAGISKLPETPLLVVGRRAELDGFLKAHELGERPAALSAQSDARAWTASRPGGKAILFVEAEDAAALGALIRPLPHYRSKSFILFQQGKAVENGVWPTISGPMVRRF